MAQVTASALVLFGASLPTPASWGRDGSSLTTFHTPLPSNPLGSVIFMPGPNLIVPLAVGSAAP